MDGEKKEMKRESWFRRPWKREGKVKSRFDELQDLPPRSGLAISSVALAVPSRSATVKECLQLRAVRGLIAFSCTMWVLAAVDLVWGFDLFNMLERLIRHLLGGILG